MVRSKSHDTESLELELPEWMHDYVHSEIVRLLKHPTIVGVADCEHNSVDKLQMVYQPLAEGVIWSATVQNLDDDRVHPFLRRKDLGKFVTAEASKIAAYMIAQLR